MEKDRELKSESGATASRRAFLQQAVGVGLATVSGAVLLRARSDAAEQATPPKTAGSAPLLAEEQAMGPVYRIQSALKDEHGNTLILAAVLSAQTPILRLIPYQGLTPASCQFEVSPDGHVFSRSLRRFLTYNRHAPEGQRLSLASLSRRSVEHTQEWRLHPDGRFTIIRAPNDGTVLMAGAGRPEAVSEVSLAKLPKGSTPESQSWLFVEVAAPGITDAPGKLDRQVPGRSSSSGKNYTHVPDQCDHTWHNPACPGSAATWISCSLSGSKCTCVHS